MRSVHFRAPSGSSAKFVCFRSIPICPGIVRFVRVRSVHSYAPWGVLVFVRVLSVDSRAPCRSSCLFWYFHPIPVRPGAHGVGWVQFHSPWVSSGSLVCVQSIRLLPGDRRVRSVRLPCALGVVGLVRFRSVNSRAPWGSSVWFVCVRSVSVHPGGRRVRWCAFGPFPNALGVVVFCSVAFGLFPCALRVVMFFLVLSAHSRAPWGSSGAFGPFTSTLGVFGFGSSNEPTCLYRDCIEFHVPDCGSQWTQWTVDSGHSGHSGQ